METVSSPSHRRGLLVSFTVRELTDLEWGEGGWYKDEVWYPLSNVGFQE